MGRRDAYPTHYPNSSMIGFPVVIGRKMPL
jgi:hypothetical protein